MNIKKKLLVFHTTVAPYRVDFFNNLAIHFDMFVCVDRKVVYGSLFKDIEKLYTFEYEEVSSAKGFKHIYKFVAKFIKAKKPDIVMVPECGLVSLSVVFIRLFSLRKFSIVSIVDDSFDQITHGRQFSRKHIWAEKILFPFFNQIITVDERVSQLFNHNYGKGVSFPIIRDESIFRDFLKQSLPISKEYISQYKLKGRRVILYVGRFVKVKNLPTLIRVFNKLNDDVSTLVMVGSGEDEKSIMGICKNENIIFTGALSGLPLYAWYNIANVFVLPSIIEPFGAVTNEALMAGCKCLITERAGSSCLINEGVNGYCFDPMNETEMVEKLQSLLNETKTVSDTLVVRPCLMQTTFEKEINKVIEVL